MGAPIALLLPLLRISLVSSEALVWTDGFYAMYRDDEMITVDSSSESGTPLAMRQPNNEDEFWLVYRRFDDLIRARKISAVNGTNLGNSQSVNTDENRERELYHSPVPLTLPEGRSDFVIAYYGESSLTNNDQRDVLFRIYDSTEESAANTRISHTQRRSGVAVVTNSTSNSERILLIWESKEDDRYIRGRVFETDGSAVNNEEFLICGPESKVRSDSIGLDETSQFLVACAADDQISIRTVSFQGQLIGSPQTLWTSPINGDVDGSNPVSIAALPRGYYTVAWNTQSHRMYLGVFDSMNRQCGEITAVHSDLDDQDINIQVFSLGTYGLSRNTALFIAKWEKSDGDHNEAQLFGMNMNEDGTCVNGSSPYRIGEEIQVSRSGVNVIGGDYSRGSALNNQGRFVIPFTYFYSTVSVAIELFTLRYTAPTVSPTKLPSMQPTVNPVVDLVTTLANDDDLRNGKPGSNGVDSTTTTLLILFGALLGGCMCAAFAYWFYRGGYLKKMKREDRDSINSTTTTTTNTTTTTTNLSGGRGSSMAMSPQGRVSHALSLGNHIQSAKNVELDREDSISAELPRDHLDLAPMRNTQPAAQPGSEMDGDFSPTWTGPLPQAPASHSSSLKQHLPANSRSTAFLDPEGV